MQYNLPYKQSPNNNEYLELKSLQLGNDEFVYWVTKKQDDPNYELINSDIDSILVADNENLKQALISSQKAVFTANNQIQNMQQVILKMQKQQFMQQNNGGNDNVSK